MESGNFLSNVIRIIQVYWPMFLSGTGTTLLIALVGTVCGTGIGLLVGVIKAIPAKNQAGRYTIGGAIIQGIHWILTAYIEVFRGTPMMVQAMLLVYGVPLVLGSSFVVPTFPAALVIVSINTGAYMAEVVRGGMESIDIGQSEAAKAIGMTHSQTMFSVILPQTLRNILPATGNEFVINIKDTSVLMVISITDLFYAAKTAAGATYLNFESYLVAAGIYLILTLAASLILRYTGKRMDGPQNFTMTSSTMPNPIRKEEAQPKRGR